MQGGAAVVADRHIETVRRLHAVLASYGGAEFPVRLWDGTLLGPPDGEFELRLARPSSLRAMLMPPTDLAAGEAYLSGEIDIAGDIFAALRAARDLVARMPRRAQLGMARMLLSLPAPRTEARRIRARLRGRRHRPARDQAAISHHYDLPAAFYEQFLDSRLVYSCAYYADGDPSLDAAQERKLDLICHKLRLRPGQRLLDIGCGFGSLLLHAAERCGVEAVGVTLSTTQAEAGREHIAAAGLSDRVEIRLADYRELHERFDAVASIGMVEHVGPENIPSFTAKVRDLTEDGGLFLLHGIVLGDPDQVKTGREQTFVSKHVFPDGGLVPAWRMVRDMERGGFALLDVEQLRPHYALTLRDWIRRLESNHDDAAAVASEAAYRTWRIYMAASALSFEEGSQGVVQILGVNGRVPTSALPLGRRWMLPE